MAASGTLLQLGAARESRQDEPLKLRAELVVLDAQVLNKKTSLPVRDLVARDFLLYEDGVKQRISHFSRDQLPLSVVILVDVSGSVKSDDRIFDGLRRGAVEALILLKPEDEVALVQFARDAAVLHPFTRDRDAIANAMSFLDGRGQIGTNVGNGIRGATDCFRSAANPDSRRAIIVVTDDVTIMDKPDSRAAPMTPEESESLRNMFEQGIVLCTLLYDGNQGAATFSQMRKGIATYFAKETGGVSIKTSREDIPARLGEMIDRLRQRYTIGYQPTNTNRDGKFRKIRLRVTAEVDRREAGVAVITRTGYYAK